MLFAEYDRNSPIKNFTDRDRLNLHREFEVDHISYMVFDIMSQIYCRKYEKWCESGKSGFKQMFFLSVFDCQSHMSSAVFFAIIAYCFIKKVNVGIHLRIFSSEYHSKREGYKVETSNRFYSKK